jgi:hypothetical protein
MAAISPDNFDPLRRYIDVRLQMGVPLVDRDWNELADMRRFELRTMLKWFVGDGVPAGSNAFLIEGRGEVNNFVIRAGASATPAALLNMLSDQRSKNIATALGAGRCVVDGREVIIEQDVNFTAQPLHVSQPGSAALAASLQVPRVQMPPSDPANPTRPFVAYLDVWEHAVVPNDDPGTMILPVLGIESCARVKREWVVRVGVSVPVPVLGASDYLIGHSYYALASINRRAGDAIINAADVTDMRQTGLNLADIGGRLSRLEQLLRVVPGTVDQGTASGSPVSGTFAKVAELTAMRPGSYTVRTFLTNPQPAYGAPQPSGIFSRVFVNDVASAQSTERNLQTFGTNVLSVPTEVITVAAGDRIQLYARKAIAANTSTGVIGQITISIANPLAPAVR